MSPALHSTTAAGWRRLPERRFRRCGLLRNCPTDFERPQAVAALGELERAASREERHVLLSVYLVRCRGSIGAGACLELPEQLAVRDVVGREVSVRLAVKQQAR